MNPIPIEPGRVVLSRAGRDQKRYMVVLRLADAGHAYVADGVTRKVGSPKKKKLKHLEAKPYLLEDIRSMLDSGSIIQDAQVRKNLQGLGYNLRFAQQEEGRGLVKE